MERIYDTSRIRLTFAALTLTALVFFMSGCKKREGVVGDAAVGAGTGAVVGYGAAAAGSKGAGAAVGGVAGLVIGSIIGGALADSSEKKADKKKTKK
jgi:hypothetical protein